MRRDCVDIDRRNDDYVIAKSSGVAAIPPYHAEDLGADCLGMIECRNEVRADVFLRVSATDRKYEHRIIRIEPAGL
jgi:hypothetical protein